MHNPLDPAPEISEGSLGIGENVRINYANSNGIVHEYRERTKAQGLSR